MTLTYYVKRVNGKLYPKEHRTNPKAAYCVDVSRVDGIRSGPSSRSPPTRQQPP